MKKIDLHWYSENDLSMNTMPLKGGIIFLPGRSNYAYSMVRTYTRAFDLSNVGLFGTTPRIDQGWYPPPNGPGDQEEAVSGLGNSDHTIEYIIDRVCSAHNLSRDKIILSGFSMGAVASVHWAMTAREPVAAVVCHSGAILEPWNVPKAKHDMPIVLNHGMDDYCFGWEERYLPMKRALVQKGYNTWFAERTNGDHFIHQGDVSCCQELLEKTFDVSLDWQPFWSDAA